MYVQDFIFPIFCSLAPSYLRDFMSSFNDICDFLTYWLSGTKNYPKCKICLIHMKDLIILFTWKCEQKKKALDKSTTKFPEYDRDSQNLGNIIFWMFTYQKRMREYNKVECSMKPFIRWNGIKWRTLGYIVLTNAQSKSR